MTDAGGRWACLFSGGKDSTYALHLARERGLDVGRLVTVHPPEDSYLYHVPATRLAALAAESIAIPLLDVETGAFDGGDDGDDKADAASRGDAEVEPLEAALAALDGELAGGLAGVVVGAVESEFQADRIGEMAGRLGCDVFAPLWRADPGELAAEMHAAGLEVRIVAVAAEGLDESWLGRTLDAAAFADLEALHERHGVHVLGEGGEYETLVTDGPHMARSIELDAEPVWECSRGHLEIADAWLG